jgi:carbonic anhydrase
MSATAPDFTAYAFSAQPGYDEPTVRREFARAVPLRTVVIYCYDPRATGIPEAIAREFGEVFPGEVITDDKGNKVASTATIFEVIVAGGRAIDALRSITVAQHLFGIENVVVVHHTHCGATSYTADGIIGAYRHEHGAEIAELYEHDSVCITDYLASLEHDTRLLRKSAGTAPHINIFGYVYDIDTGALTRIVADPGKAVDGAMRVAQ